MPKLPKVNKDWMSMDRKQFAKDLEKRTREFAVKIIRLSTSLPNTPEGKVIQNQIINRQEKMTQSSTSGILAHFRQFRHLLHEVSDSTTHGHVCEKTKSSR